MARQSFVQCPKTLKLIPKDKYYSVDEKHYIMGDIQPYKSMITGEVIHGRAQHRAHLRQHGCIEVGNEKIQPRKEIPLDRRHLKRTIADIMNSKGY